MCSIQKANKLISLGLHYKSNETLERVKKLGLGYLIQDHLYDAATKGNLEVLQWAKEKGIGWNEFTLSKNAAEAGQLQILIWMKNENMFLHTWICKFAAQFGHLEVLEWGFANKNLLTIDNPLTVDLCRKAAENGHLDILKWLKKNNCIWDRFLSFYASNKHILDWIEQGEICS